MKKKIFLMALLMLTLNACTNNEEIINSFPKQSLVTNDNETIAQLMVGMEQIAKQYQIKSPQTRNWRHLLNFAFADAAGYGAGRRCGFSRALSLGVAVLASMLSASFSDETVEPNSNNFLITYINPTLPEKIGNMHNQIIIKKVGSNSVKDINIDIQTIKDINNDAINKLNDAAIESFIPNKIKSSSIVVTEKEIKEQLSFAKTIAAEKDIENINKTVKKLIETDDSSDFDFLKQYVINIDNMNNKDVIREFTISVNNKINNSSLSEERASDLKTMIAIAENSFSLWKVIE